MAAENVYDLNDDCLIAIFKYLDSKDLMTLCSTTKRFREIVKDYVVRLQVIQISINGINSFDDDVFEMWGKTIAKLSCNLCFSELEYFLKLLLDYCSPGQLTYVELGGSYKSKNKPFDRDLVTRTAKYFVNVTTMSCWHMEMMSEWLTLIPTHQIRSLHLSFHICDDFRLNPDSFPNLIDFTMSFENNSRLDALINFIGGLPNLKIFCYRGLEEEKVLKTIAENCLNLISLGIIQIDCDGMTSMRNRNKWNFLRQLEHLETIAVEVSGFDHHEFSNIFNVLSTMSKLKVLYIHFEIEEEHETVCNEIMSFLKSNGNRRIEFLEYIELFIDTDIDEYIAQQLCYLFANTFNVKTLCLGIYQQKKVYLHHLSSIVRNFQSLEHLYVEDSSRCVSTLSSVWCNLMTEKIAVNNQLQISKILTIYVDVKCEEKLKSELGWYDPKIIAVASDSKFSRKFMKGVWY